MKKLIVGVVLLVLIAAGGLYLAQKMGWIGKKNPFSVIPESAVFVLETQTPVETFQTIVTHAAWEHTRKQAYFGEITKTGNSLSKIISENELLFKSFGNRHTLITVHNTQPDVFDFVFIVETQMLGDMAGFAETSLTPIFNYFGKGAVKKDFGGKEVYQLASADNAESLYLTFVGNLMVFSYSQALIKEVLATEENSKFVKNENFKQINGYVKNDFGNIYLHYKYFDRFMETFLDEPNDMVNHLAKSMLFTGTKLDLDDENLIALKGYSNFNDSTKTYLRALANSGEGTISSPRVISQQVSSFVNFNFDSFESFYENLETVWQDDEADYLEYESNIRMMEKLLKVDFRERFTSWIADEMSLVQLKTSQSNELKDNFVLVIQAKDITDAKINLDFIASQVKKRTPFKFKDYKYRGYEIHFLNIKGFFKIFLGKFFDKIEKPYFTYIEDYVIFSNNPESLQTMIDDYEIGLTLANSKNFTNFFGNFSKTSNIFWYVNTPSAFQAAPLFVEKDTWNKMVTNEPYIISFPQIGVQMLEDGKNVYQTTMIAEFKMPKDVANEYNAFKAKRAELLAETQNDGTLNKLRNIVSAEEESHSRLNAEDLLVTASDMFHLENQQADITFNRAVKKQSGDTTFIYNMRDNLKDGLYKEIINGVVRVKGKYKDDLKDGVWRIYDNTGRLDQKEQYKKGEKELWD